MLNPSSPVIVVIGAASTTFGPKLLRDIVNHPGLNGAVFRFVDINPQRLEIYDRLARRIEACIGHSITIESTTDRAAALRGAHYVIISVDKAHYRTWRQDFEIPVKAGIRQVMGELGGPGGLFHALRQIPLHLELARDIETHCPRAMVLICSNPLNRLCLALRRHSRVGQIVGLCHGSEMAIYLFLNEVMGIPGDDMEITAAGTNHFAWILQLRHKRTGEDLYPLMREKLAGLPADRQPMSRKFLEAFGVFPGCLDSHIGEYLPYAHEFVGLAGPNFSHSVDHERQRWVHLDTLSRDEAAWERAARGGGEPGAPSPGSPLDEFFAPRHWADTLAIPVIDAVVTRTPRRMPALNLLNEGTIANLPGDVFVESPALADGNGVTPLRMGALPPALAALNRRDVEQMEVGVEAAVTGDRRLLLQAMMLDPVVDSLTAAERAMEELLAAHREDLPQFA